jgi:RNA polymerase sigma-70 factor, ECF subfamily
MSRRSTAPATELSLDPSVPHDRGGSADHDPVLPGTIGPEDAVAFEAFYRRLFTPILRYVYRYVHDQETAEEIAQDAFYQIWRHLGSAQPVRELQAYVYTTARNAALKHLRRQQVERRRLGKRVPPAALAHGPGVPAEGERRLASSELAAAIQQAVDALPPRQREVIRMKLAAPVTHREIGAALGIDPDTVSVHFTRAIERLRRTLPRLFS